MRALPRRALGSNPLDAIGIFVLVIAAGAILVNALYRQPGPHPAPIFSIKPRPVAGEPVGGSCRRCRARARKAISAKQEHPRVRRADIITDIQRELSRRGLYDGPVDGMLGPKTDSAIRDFETSAKLKPSGEPNEDLLRAITRAPVKPEAAAPSAPRA